MNPIEPANKSDSVTILHVDDSRFSCEGVIFELQELGYEIKFCISPDVAFKLIASGKFDPDILITDMQMPFIQIGDTIGIPDKAAEMNFRAGIILALELRRIGFLKPIIVYSVSVIHDDISKQDNIRFVTKTINPCNLIDTIKNIIQEAKI